MDQQYVDLSQADYSHLKDDRLGRWSMVLSLVGIIVPFCTLAALIMGIISLVRVGANGKNLFGTIFSVAWIVLAIAILLPALNRARSLALLAADGSILSAVGRGIAVHASEANGRFPQDYLFIERMGLMSAEYYIQPEGNNLVYASHKDMSDEQLAAIEARIIANTRIILCLDWPTMNAMYAARGGSASVPIAFAKKREGIDMVNILYGDFMVRRSLFEDAKQIIQGGTGYTYEEWTAGKKIKRKLDMHLSKDQIERYRAKNIIE